MRRPRPELPLTAYAIVGDGRTAALIGKSGSVDWLCHGRFDGPAVFCRLLDVGRGGYLQVAPEGESQGRQRYVERTNVVVTELECAAGTLRVTDCMPLGPEGGSVLLRKVEGLAGDIPVSVDFFPTFDFGREDAKVELVGGGCSATATGAALRLSCPEPMTLADGGARCTFHLGAGETRWVVLTHGAPPLDDEAAEEALRSTLETWTQWSARGHYFGPYEALLRRSALVLKLLIHSPTGAMVAAPTTSLPEAPGGSRNWDYRFTWLRDASWLVSALMDLGYHDESMAFIDWLERLDLKNLRASVLYDLDGRVPSEEQELTHLRGYRSSRPIRVGNAAAGQDQHDIAGEVIAAIHMCSAAMPSMRPLRPGLWNAVVALADRVVDHWEHPDHGMWEVRDRKRRFLSSLLLCWTALDRALAIAHRDGLSGSLSRWEAARTRIRDAIVTDGFDEVIGLKRALDQGEPDATGLLLPRYGLLPADDPRVARTIDAVRRRLSGGGALLFRYAAPDGIPTGEGAFTACSFWLVDCLARRGLIDEARRLFDETTAYAGDLGLFSEEIDPRSGQLLGNYPQAFSHLALIRAATAIAEGAERGPARRRRG